MNLNSIACQLKIIVNDNINFLFITLFGIFNDSLNLLIDSY